LEDVKSEHKVVSFLSTLLKYIVRCWDYEASVVEKWMDMEHWWNNTRKIPRLGAILLRQIFHMD